MFRSQISSRQIGGDGELGEWMTLNRSFQGRRKPIHFLHSKYISVQLQGNSGHLTVSK
jgi:hypothetical protein